MGIFDRFRNVKKPQLTTDEAGLALALFARTENAETVAKVREHQSGSDSQFRAEMLFLRCLATVIGAFFALQGLLGQLRKTAPQQYANLFDLRAVGPTSSDLNSRMDEYRRLLDKDWERSFVRIGGRFSRYCGAEYDLILQLISSMEFSSTLKGAQDYVTSVAIRLPS